MTRTRLSAAALAAVLALGLAACGNGSADNGNNNGGSTSTAQTPAYAGTTTTAEATSPVIETTTTPAAPAAEITWGADGAGAAPSVRQPMTQSMIDAYDALIDFETVRQADLDLLNRPGDDGTAIKYTYGWQVCNARKLGYGLSTIVTNLDGNTGLTTGGAEAVVNGAVYGLCDDRATANYVTTFDGQVAIAEADIFKRTGVHAKSYQVGWAMRETCGYLVANRGTLGIRDYLDGLWIYHHERLMPFAKGTVGFDWVITIGASTFCYVEAELIGSNYYHS